jgi:hypothetical protein
MSYVRTERVRGFQPPWRTILVYRCDSCLFEARLLKNWSGPAPRGAITCAHCGAAIAF